MDPHKEQHLMHGQFFIPAQQLPQQPQFTLSANANELSTILEKEPLS
jgi:hypothetical protein